MRKIAVPFLLMAFLSLAVVVLPGCRRIDGPRFWWDDRNQERLSDGYALPADPSAPAEYGEEATADPSGDDLTDSDLRNYHTDPDSERRRQEERSVPDGFVDALEMQKTR